MLATMARNFVAVNSGLFEGLPTLMIPALLGSNTKLSSDEMQRITPSQASWIGNYRKQTFPKWIMFINHISVTASFAYCAHPIGSIIGCILNDSIGRRKSILLSSIPFIISWCMLGYANSLLIINVAFMIMGLGIGLKEASSQTYAGEIWYTRYNIYIFQSTYFL